MRKVENVRRRGPGSAAQNILFVISNLQLGGTERQVALLATELAKLGLAVSIYSFMDGEVRAQLEQNGIKVILPPAGLAHKPSSKTYNTLRALFAAVHLFWIMLTRRPNIVHFFLPAAYLVGAPMARLVGVPVRVMSRRSMNSYQRGAVIRALERRMHRLMHAVLGNSRSVVRQLMGEGVAPEWLGLIYNGIDVAAFAVPGSRRELRERLGLPTNGMVMCIVANLIPYKGHRDLIDALAIAAPGLPPNWRLLVAGRDDGVGNELREQAKRLGLHDHVVFLGARTDVAAILAASDIGILCSHEEGFSNSILEGMAAGLPMIVTDVGGNPEAVIDAETGLVVPAGDPKRFAAAIVRLAGNSALRTRYGNAGRLRVAREFSVQRFAQSHRSLYAALIDGKHPIDVPEVCVQQ
jgi:glycosyltransferase involved in cell wall biosynthesis